MSKPDTYRQHLASRGLLDTSIDWLAENPPPDDWKGSKWEWAHLEMPIPSKKGFGITAFVVGLLLLGLARLSS